MRCQSDAYDAMSNAYRSILIAAFTLYAIGQINAVLHGGFHGQDFNFHQQEMISAANSPLQFIRQTYVSGKPDPPFYQIFWGLVYNITKDTSSALETIALIQIGLNIAGFCLLYRVIMKLIASSALRLACIVFILFVPFIRITGVILSSDGFAIPLFLTILYVLTLLVERHSLQRYLTITFVLALLLLFGMLIKYTFVSAIAASVIVVGMLMRAGTLGWKRGLITLLSITLISAPVAYLELHACMQKNSFTIAKTWVDPFSSPYMNLRNLVFPKFSDAPILNALPYRDVLTPNKYSYPALLYLGIFTDIMNVFQNDPKNVPSATRTITNQERMSLALKTGMPFSLLMVVAVPLMVLRGLSTTLIGGLETQCVPLMIAFMSGAWFLNVVIFLPFIPNAYFYGYWLPRLVAPALCGFIILAFAYLDSRAPAHRRGWHWIYFLAVILQSGLHFSFLWP
jgi:hypothetical protein